mmetsp:Transcript_30200/g.76975  ORF Transcript_30200/g.76975 Transcript_30200/m.76975 type:complete len:289 (-) Transcript_30200:237-1103(-)
MGPLAAARTPCCLLLLNKGSALLVELGAEQHQATAVQVRLQRCVAGDHHPQPQVELPAFQQHGLVAVQLRHLHRVLAVGAWPWLLGRLRQRLLCWQQLQALARILACLEHPQLLAGGCAPAMCPATCCTAVLRVHPGLPRPLLLRQRKRHGRVLPGALRPVRCLEGGQHALLHGQAVEPAHRAHQLARHQPGTHSTERVRGLGPEHIPPACVVTPEGGAAVDRALGRSMAWGSACARATCCAQHLLHQLHSHPALAPQDLVYPEPEARSWLCCCRRQTAAWGHHDHAC